MLAFRPQPFFQYVPTESLSRQSRMPMKRTNVYQLATPARAKQPPTKSKSDTAKERYIRALAEQKAARKAYADALAEEELRKMEAQLDAPKPVQDDPATQLLRAFGLAPIDHSEAGLFAVAQEERRRRILAEQREEQHRRAEEERRRVAEEQARQEQLRVRLEAEERARTRRAAEEQLRARRAAEEQRRAALEEQQSRRREFARAQVMAYAQALRAALDAEEAERVQQVSHRKLGRVTPEPSKAAATTTAPAEPSKKKTVSFSVPVAAANSTPTSTVPVTAAASKKAKRTAVPTDPLGAIAYLERAFDAQRKSFTLPPALDFGAQGKLAFTPRNAPVHAYENVLGQLLTQLDAVESDGEESIRGERKRVVRKVEGELEGVEGRVKALWEAEHPTPIAQTHVEETVSEAAPTVVEAAVVATEKSHTREDTATEVAQAMDSTSLTVELVELADPVAVEEHKHVDDRTTVADEPTASLEVADPLESHPPAVTGFVVDEPIVEEESTAAVAESPAAPTTLAPAVSALAAITEAEEPVASADSESEVSSVSDPSEDAEEGYELVY